VVQGWQRRCNKNKNALFVTTEIKNTIETEIKEFITLPQGKGQRMGHRGRDL
jgi:hypothetical protein